MLLIGPFYHFEDRYQILPGVIASDTYHPIYINTFFRAGEARQTLRMGTPFIQVIPVKCNALQAEVRAATDDDQRRLKRLRFRSERFFCKN